jgi:outer membrane receptor protein involved in Fe transport
MDIRMKVLLSGALFFAGTSVYAQDSTMNEKLGEVIIRHHKKSTTINMLDPIKKENIGSKELLKAACCNLSESFETTPSVDVAFTDAVTGYKQIQMLGLAGPYTTITRENIPDAQGLASITGLSFTPGTWIQSMQLSKGTGSVVNGYEGLAGQINVEWRKPFEETEDIWYLNLYQNAQGRSEGNLIHRIELNENLSTNIFLQGRTQWLKTDENNDGFLDQPLDKQIVAANRWFWFAPKGWEVQGGVKAVYNESQGGQWNYDEGMEQNVANPWGFHQKLERYEGWAKIGHIFKRPATSMGLQLSGVHHRLNSSYGDRDYSALEQSFYANLIYQTYLNNTQHVLKTGVSNLVDNYNETWSGKDYKRTEVVPGAFAEYAYNGTKFNVVAGLRADYHNLFGLFVTPRLHVRYAPFSNTVLRASVGRAQRTANIFSENMGYMASNRSFVIETSETGKAYGLKPEVAWNTGLNLTQKFRLNYRDGSVSVDYYYTDFQNQVVTDVENPTTVRFYNLDGRSFANSFQAQLDYEVVHNLDVRLAYRWYDVRATYGGALKEKPLVAAHRAFMNAAYETKNHWKFDYTVQWISSKRVPSLIVDGVTTTDNYSPSFVQMNAQVSKGWKEKWEVYAGVENLTNYMMDRPIIGADNPYAPGFDASMIWGPVMGRNFYAGLRLKIK